MSRVRVPDGVPGRKAKPKADPLHRNETEFHFGEEEPRSDMEFSREAKAGRGNEMSEADADDVPCKLNNAKLSERTKERARWRHRNVMNLSEAEIHSLKVSGFRKGA